MMNNISIHYECEEKNSNSLSFVGIESKENVLKVVFPRGYNLSQSDTGKREDILLLLRTFNKYSQRLQSGKIFIKDRNHLLSGAGDSFPFSEAIWLLSDYQRNGLYNLNEKKYKIASSGNIDWSRTIKKQIPHIHEDNLVYLDFVVRKKNKNNQNYILNIQKYIIEICVDTIGWLFPNIFIEKNNKLPYSTAQCISLLRKELQRSNIDSTKNLLKNMIVFLEKVGDKQSNDFLKNYKTEYFRYIWEDMLNVVFGNEDPNIYYPHAVWTIDSKEIPASQLRPDIIYKIRTDHGQIIYVLDAKYYWYGITNIPSDLPQSSDIAKQFVYSSHIESNFKIPAHDVFILPYSSINDTKILSLCAKAKIDINIYKNKEITCILADTKTIMKQYIHMSKLDELKRLLINTINSKE